MSYNVKYTDFENKGEIIVEDGEINTRSISLGLPGRFANGYGQVVAENFLHLLENFANTEPPRSPVEGQLWYDNTDGINQIKVYDGTSWVNTSGIKKSSSEPVLSTSLQGDLWVNQETQQLYLFNGSSWILVGPEFSQGLLTGIQSETVVGVNNQNYSILTLRVSNEIIAIISSQEFSPKSAIPGFPIIYRGMTLLGTYTGISEKSKNLLVGTETVPAENFLRTDKESTTTQRFNVSSNQGIRLGASNELTFSIQNQSGVIQHNTPGSKIDIKLREQQTVNTVVTVDSNKRVGINKLSPDQALDVSGSVNISPDGTTGSGVLTIQSQVPSSNHTQGSLVVQGGVGIALDLNVQGDIKNSGDIITGNILPNTDTSTILNIGDSDNRFGTVYASNFVGTLNGTVVGSVQGNATTANKLRNQIPFSLSGDVSSDEKLFDGTGSGIVLNTQIANSFISTKDAVNTAKINDELLINNPDENKLYKVRKDDFLSTLPRMPVGVFIPYAGDVAPRGWLLCDGSEVLKSEYEDLWNTIGNKFRAPGDLENSSITHFALPDMRGRMPLGADNMGGVSANRVTDPAADSVGEVGGSESKVMSIENLPEHEHDMRGLNEDGDKAGQYYGIKAGSGEPIEQDAITLQVETGLGGTQGLATSGGIKDTPSTSEPLDVMNPFVTTNYIIYTGK